LLELFEDITYELTNYERERLLPILVVGLSKKIGPENAVTNKTIVDKVGRGLSGPRVRKIINVIRNEGLLPGLIASSKGYYITRDKSELDRYIRSLEGRESAIRKVREKTRAYMLTL